jgi:uncharacterized HAD superfamily protein
MWGISHEEAQERREEILSEKLFVKHPFFGEAKPVLVELAKNYKLVVVSSRGRRVQADTMDWINQNFKGIFEGIHFAKIWDEPDIHIEAKIKMTKTEICKEVDADYLIDDQPKHCLAVADAGITALLFGEYAWTDVPNLPKNVVRAKNWQEVLEYFDARTGL